MKEIPLSLCERTSVIENLKCKLRLDGRDLYEIRPIEIFFGKDYGCCTVSLGETRVIAQVTCEVVEPRPSRPNEGKLSLAVHLSPMAASHFEQGRNTDLGDEIQQILDKNIKESRCLDVESLCILAEESVWQFRVDVTVLNYAGNLADACNIAAVSALRHFHRPDVSVEEDGRVSIHTSEERELIPTFLKKLPVCLTYALFEADNNIITISDPTEKEERIMSGKLIIGLNPHGEITSLIFPGRVCVEKHFIMNSIAKSYIKAKSIAETIINLVDNDLELRKSTEKHRGFVNQLKSDNEYILNNITDKMNLDLLRAKIKKEIEENKSREIEMKSVRSESNISLTGKSSKNINAIASEENSSEASSSEEEFTREELSKSLPEIKAEKSLKKSNKKVKGKIKNIENKKEVVLVKKIENKVNNKLEINGKTKIKKSKTKIEGQMKLESDVELEKIITGKKAKNKIEKETKLLSKKMKNKGDNINPQEETIVEHVEESTKNKKKSKKAKKETANNIKDEDMDVELFELNLK